MRKYNYLPVKNTIESMKDQLMIFYDGWSNECVNTKA